MAKFDLPRLAKKMVGPPKVFVWSAKRCKRPLNPSVPLQTIPNYGRWNTYCNTLLKLHAQFRKSTRKNATQAARKIGRGASNFVGRGYRVFARGFAKLRVIFQQSVAIIVPSTIYSAFRIGSQLPTCYPNRPTAAGPS